MLEKSPQMLTCACAACICMSKMSMSLKKTDKLIFFKGIYWPLPLHKNTKSFFVNMRQRKKTEPLLTEYFSSILKFKVAEG